MAVAVFLKECHESQQEDPLSCINNPAAFIAIVYPAIHLRFLWMGFYVFFISRAFYAFMLVLQCVAVLSWSWCSCAYIDRGTMCKLMCTSLVTVLLIESGTDTS